MTPKKGPPRRPARQRAKRASGRAAPAKAAHERRRNRGLREVLDELITFVRHVSRNADAMTPDELEYAQQRLEWLADEVWRLVLEGGEE